MVFGFCDFDIVCNLTIVIWGFSPLTGKANRCYLNQLGLTLTFPCNVVSFSLTPKSIFAILPSQKSEFLSPSALSGGLFRTSTLTGIGRPPSAVGPPHLSDAGSPDIRDAEPGRRWGHRPSAWCPWSTSLA